MPIPRLPPKADCPFDLCSCRKIKPTQKNLTESQMEWLSQHWNLIREEKRETANLATKQKEIENITKITLLSKIPVVRLVIACFLRKIRKKTLTAKWAEFSQLSAKSTERQQKIREEVLQSRKELAPPPRVDTPTSPPSSRTETSTTTSAATSPRTPPSLSPPQIDPPTGTNTPPDWISPLQDLIQDETAFNDFHQFFDLFCTKIGDPTQVAKNDSEISFTFEKKCTVHMPNKACKEALGISKLNLDVQFIMESPVMTFIKTEKGFSFGKNEITVDIKAKKFVTVNPKLDFADLIFKKEKSNAPEDQAKQMIMVDYNNHGLLKAVLDKIKGWMNRDNIRLYKVIELAQHPDSSWTPQ